MRLIFWLYENSKLRFLGYVFESQSQKGSFKSLKSSISKLMSFEEILFWGSRHWAEPHLMDKREDQAR